MVVLLARPLGALLERDEAGLMSAPYDEIVIRAPLRKAT